MRQRCEVCQTTMIWNELSRCGECKIRANSNNENGGNKERVNAKEVEARENEVKEVRTSRMQRHSEINVKVGANRKKDK